MTDEFFFIAPASDEGSAGCCGAEELRLVIDLPIPGVRVVRVAGELDLLTTPRLDSLLLRQIEQGGRHVVVDLSEVIFLGASALGSLVRARDLAAYHGVELHLTGVDHPAVAHTLVTTKLRTAFATHPSTDSILAAVAGKGEPADPGAGKTHQAAVYYLNSERTRRRRRSAGG
jgi:anti-sigma B factor antagonist